LTIVAAADSIVSDELYLAWAMAIALRYFACRWLADVKVRRTEA
jgi:hypothetical protein